MTWTSSSEIPGPFQPPERMLLIPGPSTVHPRVLEAMTRPMIGHLDPGTLAMYDQIMAMLREVFHTRNELTFPVSGTGTAGMECALLNVLEPGETAVIAVSGAFAERMREIALRVGAEAITVGGAWGVPVQAEEVDAALREHPEAKVVGVVHVETSAGLLQPLAEIGDVCRAHGALYLVDAVASLGGTPLEIDEWGIDVCYSGSQKCLSAPPGLAPITFSPKAVETRTNRVSSPRSFYLDVLFIAQYMVGHARLYHHTAPISSLYALHEALRIVLEEGVEARWARHQEVGTGLQAALEERGFVQVPPEGYRSPQVIAVRLPQGVDDSYRPRLRDEYGIDIAGGLGEFAGKIWRFGLMGESCSHENVKALLHALDQLLPSPA
jgi:alanine-glyoxylate transaminase / serine-glyoxylate transaminase / serine-pyruvate transaminase